MAGLNLSDVDVKRRGVRIPDLPAAGDAVAGNPDDFAAAFEDRDAIPAVARNLLIHEKVLQLARAFHAEGLAFSRAQGDLHGIAADLHNLGQVAFRRGEYAHANALQQECLAIYRQLGDQRNVLLALEDLGVVAHETGDVAGARTYFQEGLLLAQAVGDKVSTVQFLERLAWVAVAQGKPACAAHLWGAAAQQRTVLKTPLVLNELADYEQQVRTAREQLTEAQFTQAWAAGQIQSLEQAIRYVQSTL